MPSGLSPSMSSWCLDRIGLGSKMKGCRDGVNCAALFSVWCVSPRPVFRISALS